MEATLIGQSADEVSANADEYAERFIEKMTFIRGRVSAEYRKTVVTNLFKDYLTSLE